MQPPTIDRLRKLHENRRDWEPVLGRHADNIDYNSPESVTLARLISIRGLELCVKAAVDIAVSRNLIPIELGDCYLQICDDEDKHDMQLEQLAKVYNCADLKPTTDFVNQFMMLADKYDPLVLNFVLETVVFINGLPLMQKYGNVFANNTASWILLDEARHVAFGRAYVSENKIKVPLDIIDFAFTLLAWVVEPLDDITRAGIMSRAGRCLHKGVPTDPEAQAVPQRISFFENSGIYYN
jgi:hypothetical protein